MLSVRVGSKAYVHQPRAHRGKLDPTSRTGVFIGYEPGSKAYRILMDDNNKVEVSNSNEAHRHVPQPDNSNVHQLQLDLELLHLQPEPAAVQQPPEAADPDQDMEEALRTTGDDNARMNSLGRHEAELDGPSTTTSLVGSVSSH